MSPQPSPLQPQKPQQSFTSTTAPGKVFSSRVELQEHYKSEWHRYNLKRREAGLPLLHENDFQARLQAALALRQEQQKQQQHDGTSHLKDNHNKKAHKNHKKQNHAKLATPPSQQGLVVVSQAAAYDRIRMNNVSSLEELDTTSATAEEAPTTSTECRTVLPSSTKMAVGHDADDNDMGMKLNQEQGEHGNDMEQDDDGDDGDNEKIPVIDPCQSLFDSFVSESVQANVDRMYQLYGFFLPDVEYLVDMEGLIGYCQEKIKLGHMCLYCQRLFRSWQSCQQHMISLRHTKLAYERGIDLDEFDPFYDFTPANVEFYNTTKMKKVHAPQNNKNINENDEEEWEDVSEDGHDDDEEEEMEVDGIMNDDDEGGHANHRHHDQNHDLYAGYQDEIAKYGFDVTPLGELILPDGRIIGHRGLARYYKQRLPSTQPPSTAVAAARLAASERIIHGRVYQLHHHSTTTTAASSNASSNHHHHILDSNNNNHGTSQTLITKARLLGNTTGGRAGQGILVPSSSGGFTSLSLYRYRAVIRKQRRDDHRGQRLHNKTFQNINRMDKKANRLMNDICVAKALR